MTVFADTFFYLALFNTRDSHHHQAREFTNSHKVGVITTQWVLTEIADAFAGVPDRRGLRAKFRVLEDDPGTKIVPVSAELFEHGLWLYDARPDKAWSLTDCFSFIVMKDEGLRKR